MTNEPTLITLALAIQRQGDQIDRNSQIMDRHIQECTNAHKLSGQRVWAVCLILLSGMVSLGLWMTENQSDKAKAIAEVASTTANTAQLQESKLSAIAKAVGAEEMRK